MVHNGLEHLAQLGLNATGLRRLLAEPVRGGTLAGVVCTFDVVPYVCMPPCLSASAGSTDGCQRVAPAEHDETLRAHSLTRGRSLGVQVNGYKIAAALLGQLQMRRLYVWVRACASGVLLLSTSFSKRLWQGRRRLAPAATACLTTAQQHGDAPWCFWRLLNFGWLAHPPNLAFAGQPRQPGGMWGPNLLAFKGAGCPSLSGILRCKGA